MWVWGGVLLGLLLACFASVPAGGAQTAPLSAAPPGASAPEASTLQGAGAAAPPATSAPAAEAGEPLLVSRVLDLGTGLAAETRAQLRALEREGARLFSPDYLDTLISALAAADLGLLALNILVTVGTALGLSALIAPLRRRPLANSGTLAQIGGTLSATLLRLLTIAIAWAVGLGLASQLSALTGQLFVLQTLYLSAFAVFGLARVALAIVASPEAESGRSLSWVDPDLQSTIYRAALIPLGIVTQGMLFVLPALREIAGLGVVRPTRVLIATAALLAAFWGIRQVLRRIATCRRADPPTIDRNALLASHPGLWVWPTAAACLYAWLVTITMPALAGQIVLAGLGGTAAALMLSAAALRLYAQSGLRNSPGAAASTFNLDPDRFTPLRMAGAGLGAGALLLLAALALLAGWGVIDPVALVATGVVQSGLLRILSAGLVLGAAWGLWLGLSTFFDRWLVAALPGRREYNRRRTLLRLFRNAFGLTVAVIAIMLALAQLGLDVAPLLAGAGVVGIAVGFGAQKLVQDIITGIFIQIENAVNEGDVVEVAGLSGGVERVSIRSIRLRALDGTLHVVPFSAVTTVSNMTRDFSAHVASFSLAPEADVAAVRAAILDAWEALKASDLGPDLRGDIEVQGITGMTEGFYSFGAVIRTAPAAQWAVGRRFTQLARESLAARGIQSPPAPRRMLFRPDAMEEGEA
ncbi:mechanosensitive ion channel family protein [Rhodobacter lacus]|uniref:Mechanosensitive ion channel family protein n=1 Tax=Rhodobacter lacus TaxID=1641972 RepID=A0ABW5AAZ9_9RHOB